MKFSERPKTKRLVEYMKSRLNDAFYEWRTQDRFIIVMNDCLHVIDTLYDNKFDFKKTVRALDDDTYASIRYYAPLLIMAKSRYNEVLRNDPEARPDRRNIKRLINLFLRINKQISGIPRAINAPKWDAEMREILIDEYVSEEQAREAYIDGIESEASSDDDDVPEIPQRQALTLGAAPFRPQGRRFDDVVYGDESRNPPRYSASKRRNDDLVFGN